LCRQMSSCNQSERDAIFGRDSYERKLSNHHDQGRRRQGATAIIELFSVTHTSKISKGPGNACVRRRGAPVPWHNGTMASPSLEFCSVRCTYVIGPETVFLQFSQFNFYFPVIDPAVAYVHKYLVLYALYRAV